MRQENSKKQLSLVITLLMPLLVGVFVLMLAHSLSKPKEEPKLSETQSNPEIVIQEMPQEIEDNDVLSGWVESLITEEVSEDKQEGQIQTTFITEYFPPQDITLEPDEFPMQVWVRVNEPLHVLSDLQVDKGSQDLALTTPILSEDKKKISLPLDYFVEKGAYTVSYKLCSVYNVCEQGSYYFYVQE